MSKRPQHAIMSKQHASKQHASQQHVRKQHATKDSGPNMLILLLLRRDARGRLLGVTRWFSRSWCS